MMGVHVDTQKCTGCPGAGEPPCVECCPGDLILIDEAIGRAAIRKQGDCWDCMSCVKACPNGALETRLPFMMVSGEASLMPRVARDVITWESRDINGCVEHFTLPTTSGGGDK